MAKKRISLEQALDNLNVLAEMTAAGPSGHYVARPDSPTLEISRMLGGKSTQQKFLLASQDGCGKTTELNRLEEMEQDKYFVVRCYHEHLYDMGEADATGFLLVLLRALADAAEAASAELSKRIAASLRKILKPWQGVDLEGVLPILGITFPIKSSSKELNKGKRGNVREQAAIRAKLGKFPSELVSMVHKVVEEIQEDRQKPLLMLVDDLEKINYQDVYNLITENAQVLSRLPFAAVYTVPLGILFSDSRSLLDSEFHILDMANIPIYYKKDELKKLKGSFTFLSKIAENRTGQFWTGLESMWPHAVMFFSGGHLRQFLSLLRFMLLELFDTDTQKIEPKHIQRAAIKINSGLRRLISGDDIEILEKYKVPQHHIDVDYQRLLRNYLILEYWQPDIGQWYLSNPLCTRSTIESHIKYVKNMNGGEHAVSA
ncbi:MAG: hypothetical protein GY757_25365 [bacterium]|nr:hypothetical protein [bacterium]